LRVEEAASLAKILLDQNIPKRVMDWLKQKGFEIVTLADASLRGAADKKIGSIRYAKQHGGFDTRCRLCQDVSYSLETQTYSYTRQHQRGNGPKHNSSP